MYAPVYMKVYGSQYETYTTIDSMSVFIAGITANVISAAIMEKWQNNPMTKAYLCMFKAFVELPCVAMIYLQQGNFGLTLTAMFIEYLLGKGWNAPCISMIQSIVDPRARSSAYAIFQIILSLISSLAPVVIGPVVEHSHLDPDRPEDQGPYGRLLAMFTMIPASIAIPLFFIAGRIYKSFVEAK